MEDKSFIFFTQDEIINKINIDPRLVDSFKRVMNKIQVYFNANGYTNDRNYKEFLQKYLIDSGNNNLTLCIGPIEDNRIGGYYQFSANRIMINETHLEMQNDRLDSTLCHEFIHFLVHCGLTRENSDPEIFNSGFIDESYTEMLTQQMYPNSNSYDAHVAMQKYFNLVNGIVNNYHSFLKGGRTLGIDPHKQNNYSRAVYLFHQNFKQKGYIDLKEAKSNQNFINAQRAIIDSITKSTKNITYDDYISIIEKILSRLVSDDEYIKNSIYNLDTVLIKSLKINNKKIEEFLKMKLVEVRKLVIDSKKYKGKNVFEFELAGRKLAVDENLNFYGDLIGITRYLDTNTGDVKLAYKEYEISFNINKINFYERNSMIKNRLDELKEYFTKEFIKNSIYINTAFSQNEELIKLQKFTMPMVAEFGKKSPKQIYIATYKDKIVLLNDNIKIGVISNIPNKKYKGITSPDINSALIWSDDLGIIENGILISYLNSKQLINMSKWYIYEQLINDMSADEINVLIEKYKKLNNISQDESQEMLKEDAIYFLAEEKYRIMTSEEKEEINKILIDGDKKFLVSSINGNITVSLMFNNSAYKGECTIILDTTQKGLYNDFYKELLCSDIEQRNELVSINLDENGNFITLEEYDIQINGECIRKK